MFRRDEGDGNPHDVVLEKLLAAGEMLKFFGTVDFLPQQNAQGCLQSGSQKVLGTKLKVLEGSGRFGFRTSRCHSR